MLAQWLLINDGVAAAPATTTLVEIVNSSGSIIETRSIATPAIAASTYYNQNSDYFYMSTWPSGSYTVRVTVDVGHVGNQSNFSNDVALKAFTH